jgi:hypothetical protein
MKTKDLQEFIRCSGWAWPGGYPMALMMLDGECIDAKTAKDHYRLIRDNMRDRTSSDWVPVATFINWEDENLFCAHSNRQIQSAYGETA